MKQEQTRIIGIPNLALLTYASWEALVIADRKRKAAEAAQQQAKQAK